MSDKIISNKKNMNYIILILSISPILGVIIQAYLSNLLSVSFGALWIITIVLNVFLAIYDSELLKKNGEYSKKMGNPMLIPVYLYKRTKILNNGLIYSFIWYLSVILISVIPSWNIVNVL